MNKLKSIFFTKKNNQYYFFSKFSSVRIAFLGVYLALMVALKYLLGFIVGIELITFMFVIAGLYLPTKDGLILVIAFNLMVMAMYGAGTWEIMYYIIWPIDFLGAKLLSKVTRNKYAIASWGFICGLSLLWWYFISDIFFFGTSFAIANIISAIPVNLIEGFTTVAMIISCGGAISKLFSTYSLQIWNIEKAYTFKEVRYPKVNALISILILLGMIAGIVLLFYYNTWFLDLKQDLFGNKKAATYI